MDFGFKEKARRTAEQLNVIDDILFRKMAEDKGFCGEVLSTILEKEIKVLEVTSGTTPPASPPTLRKKANDSLRSRM